LPGRTGKQCRERWHNHLNEGIIKGDWTEEEDKVITTMRLAIGNQWSKVRCFILSYLGFILLLSSSSYLI
jgi:hypothetical protein